MFARSISMRLKPNSVAEFNRALENEILPLLLKQKGHARPLRPNGLSSAVLEMCYSERRRLTRDG